MFPINIGLILEATRLRGAVSFSAYDRAQVSGAGL